MIPTDRRNPGDGKVARAYAARRLSGLDARQPTFEVKPAVKASSTIRGWHTSRTFRTPAPAPAPATRSYWKRRSSTAAAMPLPCRSWRLVKFANERVELVIDHRLECCVEHAPDGLPGRVGGSQVMVPLEYGFEQQAPAFP